MEAGQIIPPGPAPHVGDKGLKKDALGFISSLVIGVASTAPGYSLAATLGFIVAVTGVGLVWIAIMTAITTIGIELSARTQVGLLGAEIITLTVFAIVALAKVWFGDPPAASVDPSLSWLNPFAVDSFDALVSGVLLGVFIYWGWDSTVTVNEESRDSSEGPGRAALCATVILLAIYIVVSYAAQSF